jgi:hypothetical protein
MLAEDVCRGQDCRACLDAWPECFGELHDDLVMDGRAFRMARAFGCKAGCGGGGCIRVCPVRQKIGTA